MIDAHHHLWSLSRPECRWPTAADGVLHRDFTLDEYRGLAAARGIGRSILVQTQEDDADTDWLLDLAADEPLIGAVVGWADLEAIAAAGRIAALATRPKLAGLRPMVQHRADDWYDSPAIEPALAAMEAHGLALDALIRPRHLAALHRLALRHANLAIVIDHGAKPAIGVDGFAEWHAAIAPLAALPNVSCKLSGLLTERGDRPAEAVAPYVAALLDLFGPARLMWGSDWPVLEAAGSWGDWLDLALALVPEAARVEVFENTAARIYGLAVEALQ